MNMNGFWVPHLPFKCFTMYPLGLKNVVMENPNSTRTHPTYDMVLVKYDCNRQVVANQR